MVVVQPQREPERAAFVVEAQYMDDFFFFKKVFHPFGAKLTHGHSKHLAGIRERERQK